MPPIKILKANEVTTRYRYHCNTCGNTGTYRSDKDIAREDGKKHRRIPGNENHIIVLESETRSASLIK